MILKKQRSQCEPCKSAKDRTIAKFYCVECKEYLCVRCQISHAKLKVSKLHKTVEVDMNGGDSLSVYIEYSKLLMCTTHPRKDIEFYCEDDDDIFCSTCAFLHHRSCDTALEIKSNHAEIDAVDLLPVTSKKMQKLKCHVEKVAEIERKYAEKLKTDEEKVKDMVKAMKSTMMKKFDIFQGQVHRQMKEKNHEAHNSNSERVNKSVRIISSLEQAMKTNGEIMTMGYSGADRVIISRRMVEKYKDLENQVKDIGQQTFSRFIFEANEKLMKSLCHVDTFGSFKVEDCIYDVPELLESKHHKDRDLKLEKTGISRLKGRNRPYFSSACYIKEDKYGRLVLADQNNKRMFVYGESSGTEMLEMKTRSKPYMIVSTETDIYACFPAEKKIRRYHIKTGFKESSEIHTRNECYAMDCHSVDGKEKIIVSLYDGEYVWELVTFERNGKEIASISSDNNGRDFKAFWNIMVFDDTVFQSCQVENAVYAFTLEDAEPVFEYRNKQLKCPGGMSMDYLYDNNIYICGISSHNIHVITLQGKPVKIVELSELAVSINIAFSDNGEDAVVLGNADAPGPFFYVLQ